MDKPLFQMVPLWLVFAATVGFILVPHARLEPLVQSTLGLLAFLLAFTFGMASSRFDARRQLVVDDAVAIRTASLRAQQLPDAHRNEVRPRAVATATPFAQPLIQMFEVHSRRVELPGNAAWL
jgi:hypothetical protein